MNIYSKKINEISYKDIQEFCTLNIAENDSLEYKAIVNDKLEKEVAAFANAIGGVVIVGVNDDKDGRPLPPFEGIEYTTGLDERITNIISDSITPPVYAIEQSVCKQENGNKVFIVIRVKQSELAPHYLRSSGAIPLRKNSTSRPASVQEIEWLWERRDLSRKTLEQCYRRVNMRLESFTDIVKYGFNKLPQFSISISPYFLPGKDLIDYTKLLKEVPDKILEKGGEIPVPAYRKLTHKEFTLIPGGVMGFRVNDMNMFYEEIDSNGFYFLCVSKKPADGTSKTYLDFWLVIETLNNFLRAMKSFFEILGYRNPLDLRIAFYNLGERSVSFDRQPDDLDLLDVVDKQITINEIVELDNQDINKILEKISSRISWSLGRELDIKTFEKFFPRK